MGQCEDKLNKKTAYSRLPYVAQKRRVKINETAIIQ